MCACLPKMGWPKSSSRAICGSDPKGQIYFFAYRDYTREALLTLGGGGGEKGSSYLHKRLVNFDPISFLIGSALDVVANEVVVSAGFRLPADVDFLSGLHPGQWRRRRSWRCIGCYKKGSFQMWLKRLALYRVLQERVVKGWRIKMLLNMANIGNMVARMILNVKRN